MERKTRFFVSRKNALTWLMALCLVGSAVARIAFPGLKGSGDAAEVWSQIVLPVAATLLYVLIVIFNGKEMFYKTAIPVWLMGLYYALRPHVVIGTNTFSLCMFYICIVFFCILYTAITCGKLRYAWLLLPMYGAVVGALVYSNSYYQGIAYAQSVGIPSALLILLADYLLFAGLILLVFAIRVHSDGAYHPTWGDRNDGRKIRTRAPMAQITASGVPAISALFFRKSMSF